MSDDAVEYWPKDIDAQGYDRLCKYLETSGEYAILHGSNSRNHFCMRFDCETWNSPDDQEVLAEIDQAEEPDWRTEYEKAISMLASVRQSYKKALTALYGGIIDIPDIHYLTLNTSEHVIMRGVSLLKVE